MKNKEDNYLKKILNYIKSLDIKNNYFNCYLFYLEIYHDYEKLYKILIKIFHINIILYNYIFDIKRVIIDIILLTIN